MSTLGRNIVFPIYNGDGTLFHNLVIKKSTSDSIVMSLGDKITGDVYYKDNTLTCQMDEYIMLDGVKYSIVNPPTVVREGLKSDNSEFKGMTKYSFEFYHPMYLLGNAPFSDVAVNSSELAYKSHDRTFSWIGNLTDYVAKLNKNLQGTQFIVGISSSIDASSRSVLSNVLPFNDNTVADALKTGYDTWHYPYVVDSIKQGEAHYNEGKRFLIQFGNPTREILDSNNQPFVFNFGKGVGLKNNSRTPRNNKIVTRVAGYGSEQNIPYGYPQIPWTGDPSATQTADGYPIYDGIVGGVVTKLIKHPFTRTHLMPSVYVESVRKKVDSAALDYDNTTPLVDYYDAPSTYPNPINLDAPKLDIVGMDDIKPELGDIAILGAVPVNDDLTPASGWDDTMDDDGNYKQSYFKVTIPQLDFDLYATASITEEMKINLRSGACIGCTFDVQVDWDDYKKNFFDEQGNFLPNGSQRDLNKYPKSNLGSITIVCKKDLNTFGTLMPNVYQYPIQGDKFVFLGISLPRTYIANAQGRLDDALMAHMLDNNVYYYDYPLKFDEDFFYNNIDILSQVRTNTVLRFMFGNVEKSLYVKQITVKYGEGVLPKYDITLTDNIEVVLNQVGIVADDVSRLALAMMQLNKRVNITTLNGENLEKFVNYTIVPNINDIQEQVDNAQVTYFHEGVPTLSNYPASDWSAASYPDHVHDMYYDKETGKGYEFDVSGSSYAWSLIQDEDIVQALQDASHAQDTADGKRRVFVTSAGTLPTPPYDQGDLWVNATYPSNSTSTDESQHKYYNDILKCVTPRAEGATASINDWTLSSKYTDDTLAEEALYKAENVKTLDGNLLLNSGFVGEYDSETPTALGEVNDNTPMFSDPLRFWDNSNVEVGDNSSMVTRKAATITSGYLKQSVGFLQQGTYMLSFKASVTSLQVSFAGISMQAEAHGNVRRYDFSFNVNEDGLYGVVEFTGSATIGEIMLTFGTIPREWQPSQQDNDRSLSEVQQLEYLQKAIAQASTKILGGLVLTQMIKVGNYRLNDQTGDFEMSEETGGLSGYVNDVNSPFTWGGGTLSQAIYTIAKYANNPAYEATPNEVQQMAQYVVTHGGRAILNDVILRGYIYALGGKFRGSIEAEAGYFKGELRGASGTFKQEISSNDGKVWLTTENSYYGYKWLGLTAGNDDDMSGDLATIGARIDHDGYDYGRIALVKRPTGQQGTDISDCRIYLDASDGSILCKSVNALKETANDVTANTRLLLNSAAVGHILNEFTPSQDFNSIQISQGNKVLVSTDSYNIAYLPTLTNCRAAIGVADTAHFAIDLIVIAASGASFTLYGYRDGSYGDSDCPHIRNYDNYQDMTSGIAMAQGDTLKLELVYNGTFNAFIISQKG